MRWWEWKMRWQRWRKNSFCFGYYFYVLMKKSGKFSRELLEQFSPYLQSSTTYYAATVAMLVLTFVFILGPTYAGIVDLKNEIVVYGESEERFNTLAKGLELEKEALLAKVRKSTDEVSAALEDEVLPEEGLKTDLVRFFERKVNELNVSNVNGLELVSAGFGDVEVEDGLGYLTVKLSLVGSEGNFYRFLQVLENSGVEIVVEDLDRLDSPLARAGVKEGDVIEYIVRDGEKLWALLPWVVEENLEGTMVGEDVVMGYRRYQEATGKWLRGEVAYAVDVDGESLGASLVLGDGYSRQFLVDKVSAKLAETEGVVSDMVEVAFNVELRAFVNVEQ